MTGALPSPVTTTDQFLSALVDEMRGLRSDMAGPAPVNVEPGDGSVPVELTEPVRPTSTTKRTRVRTREG